MAVLRLDIAVRAFAEALEIAVPTVVEKLAIDIFTKLSMKTPVDTGRARASWLICEGDPNTTWVPAETEAKGRAAGAPIPSSPPGSPTPIIPQLSLSGNKDVWIISNLDYMEALENGHSKQAPAGMINITLLEVEVEIEQILASLAQP